MRIMLLGGACAAVLALGAIDAARAEVNYPYCAMTSGGYGGASDTCGFVTLEQCRQTISGGGGWCQVNPRYSGPTGRALDAPARRARTRTDARW